MKRAADFGSPSRGIGRKGVLDLAYEEDERAEQRRDNRDRNSLEPDLVASASAETEARSTSYSHAPLLLRSSAFTNPNVFLYITGPRIGIASAEHGNSGGWLYKAFFVPQCGGGERSSASCHFSWDLRRFQRPFRRHGSCTKRFGTASFTQGGPLPWLEQEIPFKQPGVFEQSLSLYVANEICSKGSRKARQNARKRSH